MNITLSDYETWNASPTKELPLDIASHTFTLPAGKRLTLHPRLSVQRNITVLAPEWLPVRDDGIATYEGMIHSPAQYPRKSASLRIQEDGSLTHDKEPLGAVDKAVLVGGSTNYYHWLIDYLPRLVIAEGKQELEDWPLIFNSDIASFQLESLAPLDIDEHRLLRVADHQCIHAKALAVPTLLSSTTLCHPVVPKLLKRAFPSNREGARERVYLSREDAQSRRLVNEVDLLCLLSNYGFEKHVINGMSFQRQVDLFASAEAVVSAHGAGLTNIVFCPPKASVFEISIKELRVSSMYCLALLGGQSHQFINATVATAQHPNPLLNDWEVDLAEMQKALSKEFI